LKGPASAGLSSSRCWCAIRI